MIHPTQHHSLIHPDAKIADNVHISPSVTIHANVEIGAGTFIGPNVVIYDGVQIGKNCYISSGCVLASETQTLEFWRKDRGLSAVPHPVQSRIIIGEGVHLEPGVSFHGGIEIGDRTWLGANVVIHDGARIGKDCRIFPGAVLSSIPQDLKFQGERTTLEIGDRTTVREFATLNRGTTYHGKTSIGNDVLIMAYVHVAHDCIIGDNVILVNAVNMGGHVEIDDYAIVGGTSAIHQFVRIGKHAMIAGGSLVRKDVPPYIRAGREPIRYEGINAIGLRRRGYTYAQIEHLQSIYRTLYQSGMNNSAALAHIIEHAESTPEREEIIRFVKSSTRGLIKGRINGVSH